MFSRNTGLAWTSIVLLSCMFLLPMASWAAPPVADAGEDQTVRAGQATAIRGSATDPDGDPIVGWKWTIESGPVGPSAFIMDDNYPDTAFQADLAGDYVLSLIASDGTDWSDPTS